MRILAIDPGPTESAWVVLDGDRVVAAKKQANEALLADLRDGSPPRDLRLAIEMIASYGMPVGAEVFETCVFIGRLLEAWGNDSTSSRVYRKDVKLHLCGQPRAKDGNVRQALIDKFGGKQKAIGNKKQPGPLYGISGDIWQALAVAVTFADGAVKQKAA